MPFSFITKTSNINKAKYSFYALIVFSVLWTILVPNPLKNYSPIFFGVSFGIFFFLYFDGLMNLSDLFRCKNLELFKKYETRHSIVDIDALFKSKDWSSLDDDVKLKIYILNCYLNLSIVSFALIMIFGFAVVYLK